MLVVVVARVLRRAAVECSGGRVVGRKEVVMVDWSKREKNWSANRLPFKMLICKKSSSSFSAVFQTHILCRVNFL